MRRLTSAATNRKVWICTSAAPSTPQFETTWARVPAELLSGLALSRSAHAPLGAHDHSDPQHGTQFDTWSCQPGQVFCAQALRQWLKAAQPGVLRLKGLLRTAEPGGDSAWSELQFAPRHGTLRRARVPVDGAALVAIGLRGQLPRAALSALFAAPGSVLAFGAAAHRQQPR